MPGVSEAKARAIVRNFPRYAQLQAVYQRQDLSDEQKARYLEDKMDTGRKNVALSRKIHLIFTSTSNSTAL